MEDAVLELMLAGIATELLCARAADGTAFYGVRLRPFGRQLPKNKMIVAGGETFSESLIRAIDKAESRRWEALDWTARPWEQLARNSPTSSFGLGQLSGPTSPRNDGGGYSNGY